MKTALLVVAGLGLFWMQDRKEVVALDDVTHADAAATDAKAIRRAALDYIEAFYEVKPEYLERSVSKKLTKYGYYMPKGADRYRGTAMTFDGAVSLAKQWNAKGKLPASAPKIVRILDQLDQTAAVKVTAQWGVDYMHLEKVEGKWKIRHVMWQSVRKKAIETTGAKRK